MQSEHWVTSLLTKLQVDWCRSTEVLINSYNCCYNGLEIIRNAWFTTMIGPENSKF